MASPYDALLEEPPKKAVSSPYDALLSDSPKAASASPYDALPDAPTATPEQAAQALDAVRATNLALTTSPGAVLARGEVGLNQSGADLLKSAEASGFFAPSAPGEPSNPQFLESAKPGMGVYASEPSSPVEGLQPGMTYSELVNTPLVNLSQEHKRVLGDTILGAMPAYQALRAVSPERAAGVAEETGEFATGMTSPTNLALVAGMAPLSEGAIVSRLVSLGFGYQMAKDAVQKVKAIGSVSDPREQTKLATGILLDAVMATMAVKHGLAREGAPAVTPEQRAAATADAARMVQEARTRMQADQLSNAGAPETANEILRQQQTQTPKQTPQNEPAITKQSSQSQGSAAAVGADERRVSDGIHPAESGAGDNQQRPAAQPAPVNGAEPAVTSEAEPLSPSAAESGALTSPAQPPETEPGGGLATNETPILPTVEQPPVAARETPAPAPADAELPAGAGANQPGKGLNLEVRDPSDNVSDVLKGHTDYPAGATIETLDIKDIKSGGVADQKVEKARVDKLVEEMGDENGHISRLIVDHDNNVVEGQHRLEALRELGITEVPVVKIHGADDFIPDVAGLVKALNDAGIKRRDQVNQMISHIGEILMDEKGDVRELENYDAPQGFERAWDKAVQEIKRQTEPPAPETPPVVNVEPARGASEAVPETPKLQPGQKQGDLLGGSEDLTLVGEKAVEKAPAKPKQPSIDETVADAVKAYGDIPTALDKLQDQIDHPDTPPADKARLRIAQRRMEAILEDQSRREQTAEHDEDNKGKYELVESVKELGGLPTLKEHGREATGELKRIMEAKKGAFLSLFRKGAKSLDTLREALVERGFDFETPHDMIAAIEDTLTSGKKRFGEKSASEGPGAAAASEFPEQGKVGAYNAKVDEQRAARGLEPLMSRARETNPVTWDRAVERIEHDPDHPEQLVEEILAGDKKSTSRDEQAELLWRLTDLANKQEMEDARAADETLTPREQAEAALKSQAIERRLSRTEEANRIAGSQEGAALQFRQVLANQDYTYGGLMRKARKANGGNPLSAEERATIAQQAKDIEELQKKVEIGAEAQQQAAEQADIIRVHEATIKDLQEQAGKAPRFGKEVFDIAHGIVDRWKADADLARASLRERLGRTSAGVDPTIVIDVARILRAKIGEFGLKEAELLTSMVAEFGDAVRPYFSKALNKAKQMIAAEKAPGKVKEVIKAGTKPKAEKTPVDIKARAKAEAAAGKDLSHKTVYELVRSLLNEGVEEKDVLQRAHTELSEYFPDIEQRDVNRAYVDYGKKIFPSKEEVAVKMRHLRALTKIDEDIARIKEGLAGKIDPETQQPMREKKIGYQREKADLQIREKMAQRAELLKKVGLESDSPEALASREQARITAKNNAIEALNKELETGEKQIREAPPPPGPELERKTAELNAMRELKREIEAEENPPKSEADKQVEQLSKQRDKVSRTLAGEIDPKTGKPFVALSEAAENIQAEIDAMRQLGREMEHEAREPERIAKANAAELARLQKEADAKRAQIASGRIEPQPKGARVNRPLSVPELEQAQQELDGLNKQIADLRKAARDADAQPKRDLREIENYQKAIDRYEQKTANKDFSSMTHTPVNRPARPAIEAMKQILEARKKAYEAAKKAGKLVRSAEEIYNARRASDIARQLKEVRAHAASGNYAKPAKPIPPKLNAANQAAREQLLHEKAQADEQNAKWQAEHRTPFQKAQDMAVRWSRVSKLSSVKVFPKLVEAGLMRVIFEPLGRLAGAPLRLIAPGVFDKASAESRISIRAEAKAVSTALTSWGRAWQKLTKGQTNIDLLAGKRARDVEMMNFVGNAHGMMKEPIRQAAFEREKILRFEAAIREGLNVNDPIVETSILSASAEGANKQIFMGDNAFTRYLVKIPIAALKKADFVGARTLANTIEFLMPIVNVSSNIAVHTARLNPVVGFGEMLARLSVAAKRGELANHAAKLSVRDAETISRAFKTGAIGTLLAAYAWKNSDQFGGVWEEGPDKKRKLKTGDIKIFGITVPHWMNHAPELNWLNTVASARRVYDKYVEKHPDDKEDAAFELFAFTVMAPVKNFPFIDTYVRLFSEHRSFGRTAAAYIRDAIIPGAITSSMNLMDKERSPKTPKQEFEMGIPGLRKNVPEKSTQPPARGAAGAPKPRTHSKPVSTSVFSGSHRGL